MRILGIDPGSRKLGYGVIDHAGPGRLEYVECGVIEPVADAPLAARLATIAGEVAALIAELSPRVVAVEGVFHGQNARTALKLGQARGVVLAACGAAALEVVEYAPATIKRAVAGSGAAPKLQVAQMVRALCRLSRTPRPDAADALAAAICHAFHIRFARRS